MATNGEISSVFGIDVNDHQPAYIFTPSTLEDTPERPVKRRKVGRGSTTNGPQNVSLFRFTPLLNSLERPECVSLREELFSRYWTETEGRIHAILGEANESTLAKVSSFVQETIPTDGSLSLPTGFIATGPNIASQSLLFSQLSERLRSEINGPVVILQSGDASNLKAALKQVIRDATNQRTIDEDEGTTFEHDGRKLLNYDLEILHGYVKAHGCHKVVVAFQDSEAFDPILLADMITLFNSWMDRVPFVLLFGIATSVDLFNERLSRAASRCLYGAQFDVEQTSAVLEIVFQKVIAGPEAPLRLGPQLVSSLMERQHNHVQSVQAFTAALKYAYMCHFYANPLAVLSDSKKSSKALLQPLQPEHLEAVRMLPSFQNLVETVLGEDDITRARGLLEDDELLKNEIARSLSSRSTEEIKLIRRTFVLTTAAVGPVGKIDLYLKALKGTLSDSDTVRNVLDAVKRMSPESLLPFLERLNEAIRKGCPQLDIDGWLEDESDLTEELAKIQEQVTTLAENSTDTGVPVRSSYSAHNQSARTTVIAQKVHLSFEKSKLTKQDLQFTTLVDQLLDVLKKYFTFDNPQQYFLSEVWTYDSILPYKDVFTPRPRFSIERALSTPQDYLPNCESGTDSLSAAKPPTANLYQMYLESGSLINISDIWTAFFSIVGGEEGGADGCDERTALMLFFRGLADMKLLGMVKQSKKKVDHLAKSSWNGL